MRSANADGNKWASFIARRLAISGTKSAIIMGIG